MAATSSRSRKCLSHFKWACYLTEGHVELVGETPEGNPILKPTSPRAYAVLKLVGWKHGWYEDGKEGKKIRGYA